MSKDVTTASNTTYRCPFCTANFTIKGSAYSHIERRHPKEYDEEVHKVTQ